MKILSILAAASLAFSPMIANAGTSDDSINYARPISGPIATEHDEDDDLGFVPILGGATALGAIVLCVAFCFGSNKSTPTTTADE